MNDETSMNVETVETPETPETVETRIATLEAEVRELRARLDHEQKEREALRDLLVPAAAQDRNAVATLEQTLSLTKDAIDARIQELAEQPALGGESASVSLVATIAHGLLDAQRDLMQAMLPKPEPADGE